MMTEHRVNIGNSQNLKKVEEIAITMATRRLIVIIFVSWLDFIFH